MGYNITEEKRFEYRRTSLHSKERKRIALEEMGFKPIILLKLNSSRRQMLLFQLPET